MVTTVGALFFLEWVYWGAAINILLNDKFAVFLTFPKAKYFSMFAIGAISIMYEKVETLFLPMLPTEWGRAHLCQYLPPFRQNCPRWTRGIISLSPVKSFHSRFPCLSLICLSSATIFDTDSCPSAYQIYLSCIKRQLFLQVFASNFPPYLKSETEICHPPRKFYLLVCWVTLSLEFQLLG